MSDLTPEALDTIEATAEANKRYASRLIEDYDGDRYDEDENGYDATARQAFVAGAAWQTERSEAELRRLRTENEEQRKWVAKAEAHLLDFLPEMRKVEAERDALQAKIDAALAELDSKVYGNRDLRARAALTGEATT